MYQKPFIALTIIMFAISFFSAGSAFGFSDEPCYGVNYDECENCVADCVAPPEPPKQWSDPSGWTIELVSISEVDPPVDPPQYDWHYRISKGGNVKGLNFAAWLIPLCCTTPQVMVDEDLSIPNNGKYSEPGEGEPTTCFGCNFLQSRVYKVTPDNKPDFHLITNTSERTFSTILIKGTGFEVPLKAVVPGCTAATIPQDVAIGGTLITQCIEFGRDTPDVTIDDVSFNIVRRNDAEGCIVEEKICNGFCGDQSNCEIINPTAPPEGYVNTGSLNNGNRCPDESYLITHGSPFWLYETYSGGLYYAYCLDLGYQTQNSYPWVNLSCCNSAKFPSPGCNAPRPY